MAWDVELALQEVIYAITVGSQPLKLEQETQDLLKYKYRPDFQEQAKTRDWDSDKKRILPLAEIVGRLAALLTYVDRAINDSTSTDYVDQRLTDRAAYVVAKATCPTAKTPTPGKYCYSYNLGIPRSELTAQGLASSLEVNVRPDPL